MKKNHHKKTIKVALKIVLITSVIVTSLILQVESSFGLTGSATLSGKEDKAYAKLEKTANKFFKSAAKSYKKGEYWKSAVDVILVLDFHPTYSRLEEAILLLGNSLYKMEMYESSDKMLRYLLSSEQKTTLMPQVLLGLQKAGYQLGNYQQSLKFYKTLESYYTEDKAIDESRYYAGQAYYQSKNYDLVQNISQHVSKKSYFFPFTLYTTGLAHLKKKNVKESLAAFIELSNFASYKTGHLEIIESARQTLGYIYFELSSYQSALKYLLTISSQYSDYPNVLLAIGWASTKLEDYQLALNALNDLIENFPEHSMIPEAHFLRGQSYLKLGYYDFAIKEYEKIVNDSLAIMNDTKLLEQTKSDLINNKKHVEKLNTQLLSVESTLRNELPNEDVNGVTGENFKEELTRIKETRERLLEEIMKERQDFENNSKLISSLSQRIERSEIHKKWQPYASYAKIRAFYLKNIVDR